MPQKESKQRRSHIDRNRFVVDPQYKQIDQYGCPIDDELPNQVYLMDDEGLQAYMARDKTLAQSPEKEKKKKKEKATVAKTNVKPKRPVSAQAPSKHLRSKDKGKKTPEPKSSEPQFPDPSASIQKIPTPPKLSPGEQEKKSEEEGDEGVEIIQTASVIAKRGGIRTLSPDKFKERTKKDKLAMARDILLAE